MSYLSMLLIFALLSWFYTRPVPETPVAPRRRPAEPSEVGEAIGAAIGVVAGLAGLCWMLVWLAVFLAPLGLLVMWVLR